MNSEPRLGLEHALQNGRVLGEQTAGLRRACWRRWDRALETTAHPAARLWARSRFRIVIATGLPLALRRSGWPQGESSNEII